jgi:FkbM family methyltransferase
MNVPGLNKDTVVVQIGANDGVQDDFVKDWIENNNVQAHLVEPIPVFYEQVSSLHADKDNVTCYNVAIHEHSGSATMTYVDSPELPVFSKGLGTFDESKNGFSMSGNFGLRTDLRNNPTIIRIQELKQYITVPTITLPEFLSTNNIGKIDVFVTDTEGFDGIIFSQLDLEKYTPTWIIMETHTLTKEENQKIDDKLKRYGYDILEKGWDTIAKKT